MIVVTTSDKSGIVYIEQALALSTRISCKEEAFAFIFLSYIAMG